MIQKKLANEIEDIFQKSIDEKDINEEIIIEEPVDSNLNWNEFFEEINRLFSENKLIELNELCSEGIGKFTESKQLFSIHF